MKKHHYLITHRESPLGVLLGFIDGLEGGFAIFAGIVVGLSFTSVSRSVLIMTAMLGIFVNAVNAATIRYSTEHYRDELDGHEKRSRFKHYLIPAMTEFMLYIIVSLLAIIPLLLIESLVLAVTIMIATCLIILFIAGYVRGATLGKHPFRDGIELTLGGVIMILFGSIAGWLLTHIFVN